MRFQKKKFKKTSRRKTRRYSRASTKRKSSRRTTNRIRKIVKNQINKSVETKVQLGLTVREALLAQSGDREVCVDITNANLMLNTNYYTFVQGTQYSQVVGNQVFVKSINLDVNISMCNFYQDLPNRFYPNTASTFVLYVVRARNATLEWPVLLADKVSQGFKTASTGIFSNQFYSNWKILMRKRYRHKSHITAPITNASDSNYIRYNNPNLGQTHHLKIKVPIKTKNTMIPGAGGMGRLGAQSYKRRYYCYIISTCEEFPYQTFASGVGFNSAQAYVHSMYYQCISQLLYTDS